MMYVGISWDGKCNTNMTDQESCLSKCGTRRRKKLITYLSVGVFQVFPEASQHQTLRIPTFSILLKHYLVDSLN